MRYLVACRRISAIAIVMAFVQSAAIADPRGTIGAIDPAVSARVADALTRLDSDTFAEREEAASQLDELLADRRLGPYLAAEFGRRLLASDTSFEVRARLERYLKELPPAPVPADEPTPLAAEIGPLLDRLNGNLSAQRDTAHRRLKAMLSHVELVSPMLQQVKLRLADPGLNLQTRRALESVLDRAREVWVHAEPSDVRLPPVSVERMTRWLDDYALADPPDVAGRLRRDTAHRELVDLLVRDDTRQRLKRLLDERAAAADGPGRYQQLVDFAKPAMAAEVWGHQTRELGIAQPDDWNHRQHKTVQHLLVGVPQMVQGARRPTHFDRIDDDTAHCVSGSSLTPGDYPVRVAIPHPQRLEVMFYLVNLPTPRHRLRYAYHLRRDEADRLLEISQHTLDRFLAQRQELDETHVLLLLHLDPRAVSRFVGAYFQAVADKPLSPTGGDLGGQFTLHSAICAVLAKVGTGEAIGALEKLARSGQLQEPNHENPFHIAWIAALAIAKREPWPEVDAWLAGLIPETVPLVLNADPVPDLGASAAGLLLARHGVSPYAFDLEPAGNDAFDQSRFAGWHFTSAAGREALSRWWNRQQDADAEKAMP